VNVTEKLSDAFKFASEVALKWFEIHAEQRLKLFNFFLILAGICIAGFFTALEKESPVAASVVAALLAVVSVCFKWLDQRTSQLVKLGEDFLRDGFGRVTLPVDKKVANIFERAERKEGLWSYRQIFNVLFFRSVSWAC
jgi:hypothetical protein